MHSFQKQLQRMPNEIKERAIILSNRIKHGESPFELGAKRLRCCKEKFRIISAPIGRRYRLLMLQTDDGIHPCWIGTHESYNKRISNLKAGILIKKYL